MWKQADNITGIPNTRKFKRSLLSSGAVVLLLILSEAWAIADQPNLATNVLNQVAEGLSLASTNIVSSNIDNSMESLDDKYKLGIGDRLSFKIVEDGEDSKRLDVTDFGDVEIPYIGRVSAAGKTSRQLAIELKSRLEKQYYYQATVIVAVDFKARSQGKVYLVGPVKAPGPQDIPSDEELTLSKAILRAGGFGDFADAHHVRVTRKEPGSGPAQNKTYIVDVGKIFDKGRTELDMVLEAGDLIYVPERTIRF